MAKLFTNSYVRPVYFEAGESNGKKLFRRAPFDVVLINGQLFIQPTSAVGVTDHSLTALGNDSNEDKTLWRQDMGGYETLEPIVVNECQMGDGNDNWIGLHSIANI